MARNVLQTIAILPYPRVVVNQLLRALADLLATSPAWRLRLNVLPVMQGASGLSGLERGADDCPVIVFYQLFIVEDVLLKELLDLVCDLLRDNIVRGLGHAVVQETLKHTPSSRSASKPAERCPA